MANRNQKITNINSAPRNPRTGFTKEEKSTLFMTLGQIVMDLDRLIRANNISLGDDEKFYDEADSMIVNSCYSIVEDYYPELKSNDDDDKE